MKQVLVTGGAGGLGRAAAECLADAGYRVFSCDIRAQQPYPGVIPIALDLRDTTSIEAARKSVEQMTGRLDAVIHLAGIYMMDSFAEISEERLSAIMDVNFMGVYRINKVFLPLVMAGGGRIIITTSELALQKPLPFTGIYALSKTALECYADSLRLELQLLGVRVIAVRPGAFRTALVDEAGRELMRLKDNSRLYAGRLERIARIMNAQTGSAGTPEKLAGVYLRAVKSANPKMRYGVNTSFSLKLYSAMPRRLQAFAMRILLKEKS